MPLGLCLQRAALGVVLGVVLCSAAWGAPAPAAVAASVEFSAKDRVLMEAAFERADVNGDGKLSREEAERFPAIAEKFDALDANQDGYLSLAEFAVGYLSPP